MRWLLLAGIAAAVPAVAQQPSAAAASAAAQAVPWPDTASTRAFRRRVLDLALIYGESSGIDENGWRIEAADRGPATPGCHAVLARMTLDGRPGGEETIEVCKP